MGNSLKTQRDAISLIIFITGLLSYNHYLIIYLGGLQQPLIMLSALWVSLAVASFNEINFKSSLRINAVKINAMVIIFVLGVLLAQEVRTEYIALMSEIKGDPELIRILGADLASAFSNKAIGYGGCFAAGLSLPRLALYKLINKLLVHLTLEVHDREVPCKLCGHVAHV